MARIAFKDIQKKRESVAPEENTFSRARPSDFSTIEDQIRSVLALYALCVEDILKMIGCLLDLRYDELEPLRRNCREILLTLDTGLDLSEELAENLHILYGHCLRRLGEEGEKIEVEDLDCIRNVIGRLRHVYWHLAEQEGVEVVREPEDV